MMKLANLLKPAFSLAIVGLMSLGASAQNCPTADSLGLTSEQRSQLFSISKGGNMSDPAVQQQIMGILTPQQQNQLGQYYQQYNADGSGNGGRGRRHRRNGNGGGYANNGYNGGFANDNSNGTCNNNNGYNNSGYNNTGYTGSPYINGQQQPYYNPGSTVYTSPYANGNTGYYPGYNNNSGYNNTGYYPGNTGYNNGYNNNGYYPGYNNNNQAAQIGIGVLSGLLNSGMLNGMFNGGFR